MADGYLNFDTKINTAGFQKGLHSIGGGLESLKSQLKGLAAAVGMAFGVRELARFGKSAVETAATVNAENAAMRQTFGALEVSARSAMKRVADESGILQTRLQSVGTGIYAFAKASGMDAVNALSMMEDALRVAADSAAYYDRSLEETTASLQSFLKGNFANDAALGVSCTETTRNIAANKLFAKSYRELSEAQKQLTLLQMVKDANALSGAEGQAAREAQGWANVLGNLKEAWRQLMAVVGQPGLHVATAAVQQLTAWLTALTDAAETAVGALSAVLGWEQDQTAATAAVSGNIARSVTEQNTLTDAVKETAREQQKSLSTYDELHKLTASDNAAASAAPAAGGAAAAIPVAADAKPVEKEVKQLPKRLQRMLEPIRLAWDANIPQLISEAKGAGRKLKTLFSGIEKSLESVWTNGSGERLFGNLIVLAGDFLGLVGDIAGALAAAWNDGGRGTALVQSYSDRWNSLLELLHAVSDAARTAWNDGAGQAILSDLLEILTNINDICSNIRIQFTAAWKENDAGVRIFEGIYNIVGDITGAVSRMTAATAEWASKLDFSAGLESANELLNAFHGLSDAVLGALASAYEEILLPFGKWTIEKAAPAAINLFAAAVRVLTSSVNALKPLGTWLWEKFLKPAAKWTGGAIVKILNALTESLNRVSGWISDHKGLVQDIALVVGSLAAAFALVNAATTIWNTLAALGATVTTALGAAFTFLTSPLGLITVAIGAVIAAGVLLVKHWDEVKAFAAAVWEEISDAFSQFWGKVKAIFTSVVNFLKGCWEAIKGTFSSVGRFFSDAFTAAWNGIRNAFSAIGKWFADRWQDIRNVFSAVGSWFESIFSAAVSGVKNAFSTIGSFFSGVWKSIKDIFGPVAAWFGEKFQAAYDVIARIFGKITGFFSGIWNGIKTVLNAVLGGIESMLNGIVHAANKIIGFLNKLNVDIPDWVPGVGGKSIGFHFSEYKEVKLPRLATGTVVPANFGEFAAILGDNKREPEIVSPVSAMKQAVLEALAENNSGNGTQTIIVQLMCDGRKLAEIVRKYNLSGSRIVNGGAR